MNKKLLFIFSLTAIFMNVYAGVEVPTTVTTIYGANDLLTQWQSKKTTDFDWETSVSTSDKAVMRVKMTNGQTGSKRKAYQSRTVGIVTVSPVEVYSSYKLSAAIEEIQGDAQISNVKVSYVGDEKLGPDYHLQCSFTVESMTEDIPDYFDIAINSITNEHSEIAVVGIAYSATEATAVLGEHFVGPQLNGISDAVSFSSSNPQVAVVLPKALKKAQYSEETFPAGTVWLTGEGETTITAYDKADGTEASYKLTVVCKPTEATGTSEEITLTEAGTLRERMSEIESTRVKELTLHGPINATDIAYLREGTGRLMNLEVINLKDATMCVSDESYFSEERSTGGLYGNFNHIYVYSEQNYDEVDSHANGLGGTSGTVIHYNNSLDYAFNGMKNLHHVVWPDHIKAIGSHAFAGSTKLEEVAYPSDITRVGEGAFRETSIRSFTLPESVSSIEAEAFYGCDSLVFVGGLNHVETLGGSAFYHSSRFMGDATLSLNMQQMDTIPSYAFSSTAVFDVKFSENLQEVGRDAFNKCYQLENVYLPASVRKLNYGSFEATPFQNSLQPIDGVKYIGHVAIAGSGTTLSFREGTEVIAENFYTGKSEIAQVTFPSTLKRIGDWAFYLYKPSTLKKALLPEGLEEVGKRAFYECSSVELGDIPSTIKVIGEEAFRECSSLSIITLPEGLTELGHGAFSGCDGLLRVNFNCENVKYIDWISQTCGAFSSNVALERVTIGPKVNTVLEELFSNCTNLTKVEFAERAEDDEITIGNRAFERCSSLTNINWLEGLTSIGESAFRGCEKLKTFYWFPQLKTVGNYAFEDCKSITEINVPEGITTIGRYVFEGCSSVKKVTLPSTIDSLLLNSLRFADNGEHFDIYCAAAEPPILETKYVSSGGGYSIIINGNPFQNNRSECRLYVPAGSVSLYQNADIWKDFQIEAAPTGIYAVRSESGSSVWHTLQGHHLTGRPQQSGLYICGGKKVVVK